MIDFIIMIGNMILAYSIALLFAYGIPVIQLVKIVRGFKQGGDIKQKMRDTVLQIKVSTLIVIVYLPIALFIGGMATDAPSSTMVQFWQGFFLMAGIPLLCLLLSTIKLVMQYFTKQNIKKELIKEGEL
ncbi:hypothetical protein [Bacillus cereus]|uniref:Uncharacterized protein n=1 Tax=Bacillus cereus TaxID=1396 RepID=A0A164P6I2_BACCE|nr:hypothetical protein [Bacillus cereus]KZD66326.1 hypothetical protein B4088_2442 [Bacillus cereus]